MQGKIDRRHFLMGAAATGVAALSGLAGCAPSEEKSRNEQTLGETGEADKAASQSSWRDAPEPIEDISETVDAEVVVVGAGAGGTCAVLAAVEAGADVVCVQKSSMVMTHGMVYSGVGTKWMKAAGHDYDIDELARAHVRYNGFRPRLDFIKLLLSESAETLEWMAEAAGTDFEIIEQENNDPYFYDSRLYSTGHFTEDKAIGVAQALADKAEGLGARFYFDTTGVQLVQDDGGRVTGVIGKGPDGQYVQFNASKGVILATGDYASNPKMVQEMCPELMDTFNYYYPNDNTGEGHQMGLWAGGVIERGNHSKMCHPHNGNDGMELTDSPIKSDPFLWVNQNGERFCNEDMDYVRICNRVLRQPGQVYYIVFDDDFSAQRQEFRNPFGPANEERVEQAKQLGYWVTSDTIEGLGAAFDIPGDALAATVARYNELVQAANDADYGKHPQSLKPILKAPFHIVRTYTPSDVALGGLMVDEQMRVMREDESVIEGLFAIGNCQGGTFGDVDYGGEIDGLSLGRAAITGRLAGQYAAKA